MVILVFTQNSVPKIEAGTKCATTRYPTPYWLGISETTNGVPTKAHIYDRNPRNGGKLIYVSTMKTCAQAKGYQFSKMMVLKDGFTDVRDLATRLAGHYIPREIAYERKMLRLTLPPWAIRVEVERYIKKLQAISKDQALQLKWFTDHNWVWIEWWLPPKLREGDD